ncbi:MAG: TonB-dependent receptor [Sphingomonadales bacterium]|nr:TonB-dependent receptor [Sphingomonadales bacterium]MBD3773340.1 TonB-dependent receptor [Paracoccaceae bacterium]
MANRNFLAASASGSALALALALGVAPQAAFAQDAQPAADEAQDNGETVITVTGFRASLQTATSTKKRADVVVESVAAEDIGKLPDNSIGESIARLPGIAAQRANGRANIISIRGFGPDFSTTTLNGREQTTTNDSRAVEFDQFPSEILSGVDVYKTSSADHTAGGLVGSINLRTIRPLDAKKRVLAIGARGTYVDQKVIPTVTDKGYRVFGTFVDTFADDTMGIALSAAYTDEPYQTHDWNAWGYGDYDGNGNYGISGVKTWEEASRLKRLGINGTFQAKLGDQLTFTVDGFYSHFDEKLDQKGFEMPILCCGSTVTGFTSQPLSGIAAGSSIVTSATWTGRPIIENYATDQKNDTYSFGGNLAWDNDAGTRATIDVSWSRTDRWQDRLETTAGLGHNLPTPGGTFGYTLTDHALEFTSDFNGVDPALVLTDVQGWSGSTVQAGYDKIRRSRDDLKEIRAEVEQDIGGGLIESIKLGVDHTYRTKTLTQDEAFLVPPNGAETAAIPSNLLLTPVNLSRGFGPILSYDPRTLVGAGVLDYQANPYGASQAYDITEDVWTPFAMARLHAQLGDSELTGNIGVQAIHTSLTSEGAVNPTVKDNYWMVLPSLNLAVRTPYDMVIRFAAAKQMMRPRLPQMNNIIGFGVNNSYNPPIYTGGGGNPLLRPYRATALDLSVEKYFGNKGYVAVQLYWKHLDDYVDPSANDLAFDYSGFPLPAGQVPSSPIGIFSGPVNTHGGYIMGGEVAGTIPFEVFSPALEGFGITGGFGLTYTKAFDYNGNASTIPGYSKYVGNLTAFYENSGFSLRGSMRYRSGFLGDFSLFSGGLDRQSVLSETVIDAQIGYDFPESSALNGLSLFLQGQNLTDERQATLAQINGQAISDAWLKYQTYGRRFLAGFTYKF